MSSTQSVRILLIQPKKPRRIKVRVRGMAPLLVDPIPPEVVKSMLTGVKWALPKDMPFKEICEFKLQNQRDAEGRIAIRRSMLVGALHNAGRNIPYRGKSKIATAVTSFLPSFFQIEDRWLRLIDDDGKEPAWEINLDVGNGQTSKNAIIRPRFDTWNFDLVFQYDEGDVSKRTMEKLFLLAGKEIGLGCFRVGRKGENGQFMIESWEDITPSDWPQSKAEADSTKPAARPKTRLARAVANASAEETADSNVSANGELAAAE